MAAAVASSSIPPLTLYSARICPWAQRATLAVQETGAKVNHIEIDLQNKPSWYASKVNPASKVPVIQLGEDSDKDNVKVPESHVILELVADLFKDSDKSILPDTPVARAEARYFIERFNQVIWSPLFSNLLAKKFDQAVEALEPGLAEISGLLERHPGPFFLGDKISIADIGVAPFIGRLFAFAKAGIVPSFDTVLSSPKFKVLQEYHDTLTSRPSWSATFDEQYVVESFKKRFL